MTDPCDNEAMPRQCAGKFEEISRCLGQIDSMAADVRTLRRALLGNGRPDDSLSFRVARLEAARNDRLGLRHRWGQRLWRLTASVALVVLGWWVRSGRQ